MSDDPEEIGTELLLNAWQSSYRDALTFNEFETIASYANVGTMEQRLDLLYAWMRPAGRRSQRESGIEAALTSTLGHDDYAPGSRVLVGDAMPAAATAARTDGRMELHRGNVHVPTDVPCWYMHQSDQSLGSLVGYQHGARGAGSLRLYVRLGNGAEADELLVRADYGQLGMSVGVFHDPKRDNGQHVLTLNNQVLREISLVPIESAAFGALTAVRRVELPEHVRARYRFERAEAAEANNYVLALPAYTRAARPMETWQDGRFVG